MPKQDKDDFRIYGLNLTEAFKSPQVWSTEETSITQYLYQYRYELVERASHRVSPWDKSVLNSFFREAYGLGLNVFPTSKTDDYIESSFDEVIKTVLKDVFSREYSCGDIFDHVIKSIITTLSTRYGYVGRKEEGYTHSECEAFLLFMKNILEEEKEDNQFLFKDEQSGCIVDIDEKYLGEKLISYFLEKNIYNKEELSLTGALFRNQDAYALALIQHNINLNERFWDGPTPLLLAVGARKAEISLALIAKGVNLDFKNTDGETALVLASRRRFVEIESALINAKLGVEKPSAEAVPYGFFNTIKTVDDKHSCDMALRPYERPLNLS